MGGGVFELGNPEGRGAQAVLEIQVEGGVKKLSLRRGGVDFFWNNPILLFGCSFDFLKFYFIVIFS